MGIIGEIINKLFPVLPEEGPPLPRALKQKWPKGVEEFKGLKEALGELGKILPAAPEEGLPLPRVIKVGFPGKKPHPFLVKIPDELSQLADTREEAEKIKKAYPGAEILPAGPGRGWYSF